MSQPQPLLDVRQERARKNSNNQNEQNSRYQDHFGHKLRKKKKQIMRVIVSNPNGLTGSLRSSKMEHIQHKALAYDADVLCLTEQNQNLKRIPTHHQLKHMTQGWWQHRRVSQSYNKHYDSGKEQQRGGVSIIASNTIAHRSTTINHDLSGLGRWTSMLIQGKKGFSTRIICVYRPCKSSGPDTAYMQHALYFNKLQRKGDPRQLFMDDLACSINKWQQSGEKLSLLETLTLAIRILHTS
jgi:hypothetical protein